MSTLRAPDPPLFDEHVVLRPLADEDVAVVERALADLEIQHCFDDSGCRRATWPSEPWHAGQHRRLRSSRSSTKPGGSDIDSRELLGSPSEDTGVAPSSFITLDGLRRRGLKTIPSGWLLESSRPLTSEQIAAACELAANAGLTIETRRESNSFAKPIAIATAAGALLALAILAMTVGLIRGESAGDLRTLTAAGATSRTRRTLTGATAGALALLGAVLGVAGAYLALAATYLEDLGYLTRIPVLSLVLIVVGVPLTATAAGWLLSGREPPAIARPAIE